uniref:Secreted protein n=1 Tax=Globodera pallida TaxID=36090 RepID=A0A183BKE4_GLOPA
MLPIILIIATISFGTLTNATPRPSETAAVADASETKTNVSAVITEVAENVNKAVEDLSVKQAKALKNVAEVNAEKTPEQQEKALKDMAGGNEQLKTAVSKLLEAKEKTDNALDAQVKNQTETMSEESKKASEQLMGVLHNKKSTTEEKVKQVEELTDKMPEVTKNELNLNNTADVVSFVKSYANIGAPVATAGEA